ncbi:ThiJ/PfpI family protein [Xylaria sp. CBS 124048]|nr:ThiJ/PfpI family protein [Xylaria sp. CBS 124048]
MAGPDKTQPPTRFGVALFPGFQALDVFGTIDPLNNLSYLTPLEFVMLAATLDPVSTNTAAGSGRIGQSVMPTHTFDDCPTDLEVLIVPGGRDGTRDPAGMRPVVNFVKRVYPKLRYLLTVCNGSAIVAQSGVLDGRRATSNKQDWTWVTAQGPAVNWVRQARWVLDGNIWTVCINPSRQHRDDFSSAPDIGFTPTLSDSLSKGNRVQGMTNVTDMFRVQSSGVSAGIDLIFAFIADQYGEETAKRLAETAEYVRNTDPSVDPFA